MNEQKLLFHLQEVLWAEQLWRRVPLAIRRKIITILAEMAKLAVDDRARSRRQEEQDER